MSIWSCNLVHFFLSVFLAFHVIDAMRSLGWSDPINAWQCQGSHQRVITQEGGFSQGVFGSPQGLQYSGIFILKTMGPPGPHPLQIDLNNLSYIYLIANLWRGWLVVWLLIYSCTHTIIFSSYARMLIAHIIILTRSWVMLLWCMHWKAQPVGCQWPFYDGQLYDLYRQQQKLKSRQVKRAYWKQTKPTTISKMRRCLWGVGGGYVEWRRQ